MALKSGKERAIKSGKDWLIRKDFRKEGSEGGWRAWSFSAPHRRKLRVGFEGEDVAVVEDAPEDAGAGRSGDEKAQGATGTLPSSPTRTVVGGLHTKRHHGQAGAGRMLECFWARAAWAVVPRCRWSS